MFGKFRRQPETDFVTESAFSRWVRETLPFMVVAGVIAWLLLMWVGTIGTGGGNPFPSFGTGSSRPAATSGGSSTGGAVRYKPWRQQQ